VNIRSFRAAVSFLTVIPFATADGSPGARLGRAYFPAVGALVGLASGLVFVATASLSTPLLAAAAAVATLAFLTGALHLDGLADAADGLLGRGDIERRLEVMHDPRLGTFGVVALVVVLLLDVAALASMSPARALVGLVIAGAVSRMATLAVVSFLPYVRAAGLGAAAATGERRAVDLAVGAATTVAVCILDWRRAAVAVLFAAAVAVSVAALARSRLGGATGDVYGAAAELTQLATLLVFAAR